MPETLLRPQYQETIPDDLTFERFDDSGSGIATLADGRYVVEVGERQSGLKGSEENVQREDLSFAIRFIEQEPDIATWYGYQYIPPKDGGLARVVIPNPELLNERKNSLPPEIGVNRGIFTVEEGARFGAVPYLGMLNRGEIPVATETDEKAHDLCAHTGGFGVMSAELFDFLAASAGDALSRGDFYAEKSRGQVTAMIDLVSGSLTNHPSKVATSQISILYYVLQIPKDEMGTLINSLQASQERTIVAFREYARAQNQVAA